MTWIGLSACLAALAQDAAVVYSNPHDGLATHSDLAMLFEADYAPYDIWLGDDFRTEVAFTKLKLTTIGYCLHPDECDVGLVEDFVARLYSKLPNDPDAVLLCESSAATFDGVDKWTASFGDFCLPAGEYYFAFAAVNNYVNNDIIHFWQRSDLQPVDDGWWWNPGGGFGFSDDIMYIWKLDQQTHASPNAVITGLGAACSKCDADLNADGVLNVLDFVAFQRAFVAKEPAADCDANGSFDMMDFVCFLGAWEAGCG